MSAKKLFYQNRPEEQSNGTYPEWHTRRRRLHEFVRYPSDETNPAFLSLFM